MIAAILCISSLLYDQRDEGGQVQAGVGSLHGRGEQPAQHHEHGKQPWVQMVPNVLCGLRELGQQKLVQGRVLEEKCLPCLAVENIQYKSLLQQLQAINNKQI